MRLETRLIVGATGDPATATIAATGVMLADGRVVVGPVYDRGYLYVYDGMGRFERRIGGSGRGPGEFERDIAYNLEARGDTLIVSELGGMRVTRFDVRGTVLDELRLPVMARDVAVSANSVFVVPISLQEATRGVMVVDRRGSGTAEYNWPMSGDADMADELLVRSARGGGAWVFTPGRYAAMHIDGAGEGVREFHPASDWFVPWRVEGGGRTYRFSDLHAEGDTIWTLVHVKVSDDPADDGWSPQVLDQAFDTVLEQAEVMTGRILRRYRDPRYLRFMNHGLLSHLLETTEGDHRFEVLEIVPGR